MKKPKVFRTIEDINSVLAKEVFLISPKILSKLMVTLSIVSTAICIDKILKVHEDKEQHL